MSQNIRIRMTAIAAAFSILFQATSVWAQADDSSENQKPERTPKVYLHLLEDVGKGVSSIVARRIDSQLRDQLATRDGIKLLDRYRPGEGMKGKSISDARRLYTSAIGLLRNESFKEAATKLQKSVDIFQENLVNLRDYDVIADTYLNLAWAYYETGYDFDAKKYIHQYAHLRPEKRPDPKKFPGALIDEYEEEKRRIEQAGPGTVRVKTEKKGLRVFLDGERVGKTPMVLEEVSYGTHYLTVENGIKLARKVEVRGRGKKQTVKFKSKSQNKAQKEQEVPAFYRGMRRHIRSGSIDSELNPYLNQLAKKTNSDYVVWSLVVDDPEGYRVLPFVYEASTEKMVWVSGEAFSKQLQNIRGKTKSLADNIKKSVLEMPEARLIKSIDIDIERKKDGEGVEVVRGGKRRGDSVKPPPDVEKSDKGSNTWKYVKIGGATVAAGGLIAGGVILFSDGGGSGVDSFDAEVTW